MPDSNLIKLRYKTYIKMIENSVGTRMFNSAFVKNSETGEDLDILKDGIYSGAFYVSGLLTMFGQIDRPHSTVNTVSEKLAEDERWEEASTESLKAGDVIVWEEMTFEDGDKADQIGFYLDKDKAVSTSYIEKQVISHHPTFGTNEDGNAKRKIVEIFRSKELK